ncbi:hypothetical protein JCM19046_3864 [Bacillus sp. JCM 19046]|nr:hypothetical protein JCM19045_3839 [Bacillus sp. JCM 19045]GAF19229.1 hypothetical protein JCM19046_3864 [Bacillus sp. JCM 19046]
MVKEVRDVEEYTSVLMLLLLIGSFIPLIEYMITVPVGILLLGQPVVPVVIVSIIGNSLGVAAVVFLGSKVKQASQKRRGQENRPSKDNKRKERTRYFLNKYGMPGVGILGSILVSSHLSAATAVALGVSKGRVLFWTIAGVVIWSVILGIIAVYASHWFEPFFGTTE